jgi:putative transposase
VWVQPDTRDGVIDLIRDLSSKTELSQRLLLSWLGVSRSKYYNWRTRYGKVNEHNCLIPRDIWLEDWEKNAIIEYFIEHPTEGYRRLTYMMLDDGIVAASPSTVYRVLSRAGLLGKRTVKPSKKGQGFQHPLKAHEHWHIDVTYLNLGGTFYYLCSVLDGFSRFIVHWEIRESMKEKEVEIILQRAKEKFPDAHPRIISDNGPQFVARDFKDFIRLSGMTHVRTSPYYPQSNGKQERMQGLIKQECIRPKCPQSVEEAKKIVADYVQYYNEKRLHSAVGYVAPIDMLHGRQKEIHQEREYKLQAAREKRKEKRHIERLKIIYAILTLAKFGGNMEMKKNATLSGIPT